jgi:hypothetical protein
MLLIQRNLNRTFVLLLFSFLGTVFGILGSLRSMMIVVEHRSEIILEKMKKRQSFSAMIDTVDHIRLNCRVLSDSDELYHAK